MVEVAVDDKGAITVPRVDIAIDCGTYVNPERIHSQMEGAVIMGMSLAKYGEITFKDGKAQQGNFDDYPVLRIDEAPLVTNVHIMPPGDKTPPSGVGEPGVPPFAPALVNAIFAATSNGGTTLPEQPDSSLANGRAALNGLECWHDEEHTASCSCGAVRARCKGEPVRRSICSCQACRQRTGSAFSFNITYDAGQVQTSGAARTYTRRGDSGPDLHL